MHSGEYSLKANLNTIKNEKNIFNIFTTLVINSMRK